jgi:hypothetical protein
LHFAVFTLASLLALPEPGVHWALAVHSTILYCYCALSIFQGKATFGHHGCTLSTNFVPELKDGSLHVNPKVLPLPKAQLSRVAVLKTQLAAEISYPYSKS